MTYRLFSLRPEQVLEHWPLLKKHTDAALSYSGGEQTSFDLFRQAMREDIIFLVIVDDTGLITSSMSARIIEYPQKKVFQITTLGGSVKDWRGWESNFHQLEDFVRGLGCTAIRAWGRKGWSRRLNKLIAKKGTSFEPLYTVYSMEI